MFLFSRKPDPDPVPTDPGKSVPFGFRLSLLDFIDDEDNIENKKVVYKDINAASQWNANKKKNGRVDVVYFRDISFPTWKYNKSI